MAFLEKKKKKKIRASEMEGTPVNQALGKWEQEDHKFKDNLERDTVSKYQTQASHSSRQKALKRRHGESVT